MVSLTNEQCLQILQSMRRLETPDLIAMAANAATIVVEREPPTGMARHIYRVCFEFVTQLDAIIKGNEQQ